MSEDGDTLDCKDLKGLLMDLQETDVPQKQVY